MAKTKNSEKVPEKSVQVGSGVNVNMLIEKALSTKAPIETMEKLLAMRKELKAEKARELFFAALSDMQKAMPEIVKDKIVLNKDGSERYRYAPLESIIRQVREYLGSYGFSYTFKIEQTDKSVKVVCVAIHEAGHQEQTCFEIISDSTAYMNVAQKAGSALTYGKRYSFCNAFGIMTADSDDDANGLEDPIHPESRTEQKNIPLGKNSVNTRKQCIDRITAAVKTGAFTDKQKEAIKEEIAATKGKKIVELKKLVLTVEIKAIVYQGNFTAENKKEFNAAIKKSGTLEELQHIKAIVQDMAKEQQEDIEKAKSEA